MWLFSFLFQKFYISEFLHSSLFILNDSNKIWKHVTVWNIRQLLLDMCLLSGCRSCRVFSQILDTNKGRSKWISCLWRRGLQRLCPISCFVPLQTTDMKISLSPCSSPAKDAFSAVQSTKPAPKTHFFTELCSKKELWVPEADLHGGCLHTRHTPRQKPLHVPGAESRLDQKTDGWGLSDVQPHTPQKKTATRRTKASDGTMRLFSPSEGFCATSSKRQRAFSQRWAAKFSIAPHVWESWWKQQKTKSLWPCAAWTVW